MKEVEQPTENDLISFFPHFSHQCLPRIDDTSKATRGILVLVVNMLRNLRTGS